MNNERLYIDGQLADLYDSTDIRLDIKSNLLADISKMMANTTSTIKIPRTPTNARILGVPEGMYSTPDACYTSHTADFYRDGVQIVSGGSLIIKSVTATDYNVNILWGLYKRLSAFLSSSVSLNELESDARIKWTGNDNASPFDDVALNDYDYIKLNMFRYEVPEEFWNSTTEVKSGSAPSASGGISIRPGGLRVGSNLHPSVSVRWLLSELAKQSGVTFKWTEAASRGLVNTLCVPLVTKNANDLSYASTKSVVLLAPKSGDTLGDATLTVTQSGDILTATTQKLTAKQDATLTVTMSAVVRYDFSSYSNKVGDEWRCLPAAIIVTVSHTEDGETTATDYICGDHRTGTPWSVPTSAAIGNYVMTSAKVNAQIEIQSGDTIAFRSAYQQTLGTGKREEVTKSYGSSRGAHNPPATFSSCMFTADLASIDGEVPEGAYFPIVANLPDIKGLDFIKTLAVLTGCFPKQTAADGSGDIVEMVPYSQVLSSRTNAVDWSAKLMQDNMDDVPSEATFAPSDWCRRNLYRWKEDDTVKGSYDGCLTIDNAALSESRDVITLPFAATDGNTVPCYTRGADDKISYKACQPRILRYVRNDDDDAEGSFADLDLSKVLNGTNYVALRRALSPCRIIKEKFVMSELDVAQFDETVPVYLAQYASYFAVMELKASSGGVVEASLLQI